MNHDECKFVFDKRDDRNEWKNKDSGNQYPSNCMQDETNHMGWGQSDLVGRNEVGPDQKDRSKFNWVNVCKVGTPPDVTKLPSPAPTLQKGNNINKMISS